MFTDMEYCLEKRQGSKQHVKKWKLKYIHKFWKVAQGANTNSLKMAARGTGWGARMKLGGKVFNVYLFAF